MESLLRYTFFNLGLSILLLEIAIIVVLVLAIVIVKAFYHYREILRKKKYDEISLIIKNAMKGEPLPNIPSRLQDFSIFIKVMENFEQRFSDEQWNTIKEKIIDTYFLKLANEYSQSRYWMRRQLAARCYLLTPSKAPPLILDKLLDDKNFLVRVAAATVVCRISDKQLFYHVLKNMSEETSLARFAYRDPLIQIDTEKFNWVGELLVQEKNPEIVAVCLDILSTRTTQDLFPLVMTHIHDSHRKCRLYAIKILKGIPSTTTTNILVGCLSDEDWEIRSESLKSLSGSIPTGTVLNKISTLLNDPVWFVRLQAALTLKHFGKEGMDILWNINEKIEPQGYEIARYVLALPD